MMVVQILLRPLEPYRDTLPSPSEVQQESSHSAPFQTPLTLCQKISLRTLIHPIASSLFNKYPRPPASGLLGSILEGNAGENKIFMKTGGGRNNVVNSVRWAQVIGTVIVFPFLKDLKYRFIKRPTLEAHSDLLEAPSRDKELMR